VAIDFPSSPTVGQLYVFGGVTYVFTASGVWSTSGAGLSVIPLGTWTPQGRLTLQTNVPVMTTTVSSMSGVLYTPYAGNQIPLFDGSINFVMTPFTVLTNFTTNSSLGNAGPAAVAANSVYDLFVWSNAGVVTLTRGPAWTNDTTRSAGTALFMINGILLNNAAITNGPAAQRGTYVGTIRSNASAQLDWVLGSSAAGGGAAFLGVWNCYNRVDIATTVQDATASETVGAIVTRPFFNSTNNRVSAVFGLAEDAIFAFAQSKIFSPTSYAEVGIGFNSITAMSGLHTGIHSGSTGMWGHADGRYATVALGFNFWQMMISTGATDVQIAGVWSTIDAASGMEFRGRM